MSRIRLRSVSPRVDRNEIEKRELKKSEREINKNRDPATAQVSAEMKIKRQKAFCGRNKLKSMCAIARATGV